MWKAQSWIGWSQGTERKLGGGAELIFSEPSGDFLVGQFLGLAQ